MLRKILLLLALLSVNLCSAQEDQIKTPIQVRLEKQIENLSETINRPEHRSDTDHLNLYNERGILYLFMGELDKALDDFDHVLDVVQNERINENTLPGSALWGRLLCHAFKNQLQETYNDSLMLQQLFLNEGCCGESPNREIIQTANNSSNNPSFVPVARFLRPDEKITRWECHDRTNRIAEKMRNLTELIPYYPVRELVWYTIDKLSDRAHNCCEKGYTWTECLGPIVDAWHKLDDTWDQLVDLFKRGIKIEAFITGTNL